VIGGVIAALAFAGYFIGTGLKGGEVDVAQERGDSQIQGVDDRDDRRFDPTSRVRGRVMSVSETEIIVGTFAQGQNGPGGADREQRQNLSEEERQAFRAQREAERAEAGEPEITGEKIITITETTSLMKGRGGFGRGQGRERGADQGAEQAMPEAIELSSIEEGMTVSITLVESTQDAESISVQEER